MKVLSIGGTRPQFVKMAVLVKAFDDYNLSHSHPIEHRLLHTGQHLDPSMSEIFFVEMGMPQPQTLPGILPGPPGMQTAAMLASVEAALMNWRPDVALIYGDTNSTLAAALAAVKLHIPLVHLEAGLRSFNRHMQEEINRVISDHISDLLLCPTRGAVAQLKSEGLADRAVFVGDVMLDAVAQFAGSARLSPILHSLGLKSKDYALVTLHRAENTDNFRRLTDVLNALEQINIPVILPMHPRLRHVLGVEGLRMLACHEHIHLIDPVGYLEMLALERNARLILTDSGGVQKEAYFLGVPCLTMRDESEWLETIHGGWNSLVGTTSTSILDSVAALLSSGHSMSEPRKLDAFGEGHAGRTCVEQIVERMGATQ